MTAGWSGWRWSVLTDRWLRRGRCLPYGALHRGSIGHYPCTYETCNALELKTLTRMTKYVLARNCRKRLTSVLSRERDALPLFTKKPEITADLQYVRRGASGALQVVSTWPNELRSKGISSFMRKTLLAHNIEEIKSELSFASELRNSLGHQGTGGLDSWNRLLEPKLNFKIS